MTSKNMSMALGKIRRFTGKPSKIFICKKKTVALTRTSLDSTSVRPRKCLARIVMSTQQVVTWQNSSLRRASTRSILINNKPAIWIYSRGDQCLVKAAWAHLTIRIRCSTNKRNLTRKRHRSSCSTSTSSRSSPHFRTWWKSCRRAWKISGISWTQKPWTKFHKTFQLIKKRCSFGNQFKTSRTCN